MSSATAELSPGAHEIVFRARPSTLAYMLRAFWPSPGLDEQGGAPSIVARWQRHRIEREHLRAFSRLTGLDPTDELPLLYPHVLSFPLQMTVLTHPAFPFPIWRVLQVRNDLVRRRTIPVDAVIDFETRVATARALEKGIEVDLETVVRTDGETCWEGVTTFYAVGARTRTKAIQASARAPEPAEVLWDQWHMPSGFGFRFARLTGDYNGIHWSSAYARRIGFSRALHHPQLVLGQCLARLPASALADGQRLRTWLKGPVYYDADVSLFASFDEAATTFSISVDADQRPAIIGKLSR
jgi:hypothetical protein